MRSKIWPGVKGHVYSFKKSQQPLALKIFEAVKAHEVKRLTCETLTLPELGHVSFWSISLFHDQFNSASRSFVSTLDIHKSVEEIALVMSLLELGDLDLSMAPKQHRSMSAPQARPRRPRLSFSSE